MKYKYIIIKSRNLIAPASASVDSLVNFLRPDPLTGGPCSSIQFVGAEEDEQGPDVPSESIVLNDSGLFGFVEETSTYLDDSGTSGLGFVGPGYEPEDPEDGSKDSEDEESKGSEDVESKGSEDESNHFEVESSASETDPITASTIRKCDVSNFMNKWQPCTPTRKPSQSRSLGAAASRAR